MNLTVMNDKENSSFVTGSMIIRKGVTVLLLYIYVYMDLVLSFNTHGSSSTPTIGSVCLLMSRYFVYSFLCANITIFVPFDGSESSVVSDRW